METSVGRAVNLSSFTTKTDLRTNSCGLFDGLKLFQYYSTRFGLYTYLIRITQRFVSPDGKYGMIHSKRLASPSSVLPR